jgi:UDP-N-acetylmuramate dehydrogenase
VYSDYFAQINDPIDIERLVETDIYRQNKHFILGAGSNILFTSDYHGLVISINIKGVEISQTTKEFAILEVGAGELWHNFVTTCVQSNLYGLENLALIPGTIGAAPVQNIGAYGAEQKDCFDSLTYFDFTKNEFCRLSFNKCNFQYRNSIFKKELKNNAIITSVRYRLSKKKNLNLNYKDLQKELIQSGIKNPNLQQVFESICKIRKRKLPDPNILGNAGSFFKNPIVSLENFERIKSNDPAVIGFKAENGCMKLSAGWLIEKAGWKGKKFGDVGVYDKHALVLVNYGNATGQEILDLSEKIIESVFNKFEILLEKEVQII